MANVSSESWIERQVQTVVDRMKDKEAAQFSLVPDWETDKDRERAFAEVGARLRALGYDLQQNGAALRVAKRK